MCERELAVSGAQGLHCQSWPAMMFHTNGRPCCQCWARRCPLIRMHLLHPPAAEESNRGGGHKSSSIAQRCSAAARRQQVQHLIEYTLQCWRRVHLGNIKFFIIDLRVKVKFKKEKQMVRKETVSQVLLGIHLVKDRLKQLQKMHFIIKWSIWKETWEGLLSWLAGQ